MKLSILICHIPKRKEFLNRLLGILEPQIVVMRSYFEIIIDDNPYASIGLKRNHLLTQANGEYVCFIDDDDRVADNYINLVSPGIFGGYDCCSLNGIITEDGNNPRKFQHSIKYSAYDTISDPSGFADIMYLRFTNHLNCIKSSVAKQFRFPEKNHGEDTDWATQIHNSGLLKNEYWIEPILYYYDWRSKK